MIYRTTKLSILAVLFSMSLLNGCANNDKIDQIASDLQNLNIKTDKIEKNINTLNGEIQSVKDEAIRANQRLDNQIVNYKK